MRPSMQSSKKPRFYLPQLDALRFFAFACVFLLHALPARLMTLREPFAFGLSLFFFLSAYLITSLLKIEAEATGTVNLKGFYIRRILRIWPLYFLFVGALAIAGIHWPEAHFEPGRVVAMGLLYGNWYFILNGMGSPLASQLWSICVEEQFYAVWPSVFKALPAALFLRVTMAIAAGSLVSVFLLASTGSSTLGIWLNTLPQAVFFATGAALAFKMDFNQRANVRLSALMIAAGCCCWVLADILGITKLPTHTHPWRMTAGYAVVALGCGLLLIGALKFPRPASPGGVSTWAKSLTGSMSSTPSC
jgi:peptidoglycan/LPS O-acetylase OafA/YrhL